MRRTSDRHAMLLDHARFHGLLVELSKLWIGKPLRGGGQYGRREFQYLVGTDGALHDYAVTLAHCFPLRLRQGAHRR